MGGYINNIVSLLAPNKPISGYPDACRESPKFVGSVLDKRYEEFAGTRDQQIFPQKIDFDFSDYNNALKTGFDPANKIWPLWLTDFLHEQKINVSCFFLLQLINATPKEVFSVVNRDRKKRCHRVYLAHRPHFHKADIDCRPQSTFLG